METGVNPTSQIVSTIADQQQKFPVSIKPDPTNCSTEMPPRMITTEAFSPESKKQGLARYERAQAMTPWATSGNIKEKINVTRMKEGVDRAHQWD